MLYERKKIRQRRFKILILSIPIFILLILIVNIISSKNKTVAKFNLAIPKANTEKTYTICIDPGHGDWDYGAISPNGIAEKDITLAVSLKLGELLEKEENFKVVYTRKTDNMSWVKTANDSLKERISISKICNANIFISIHCNYSINSNDILGIETWYKPSDNNSLKLAQHIQNSLVNLKYTKDRGLKSYDVGEELAVLELNTSTAALVELGFLTNSSDETYLNSSFGQENCAKAIYKAIIDYKNETT